MRVEEAARRGEEGDVCLLEEVRKQVYEEGKAGAVGRDRTRDTYEETIQKRHTITLLQSEMT